MASFAAIGLGAMVYPSRQPVMAYVLEKPLMVMVRSAIPGSDPGLMCSRPSYRMYS